MEYNKIIENYEDTIKKNYEEIKLETKLNKQNEKIKNLDLQKDLIDLHINS